MPRYKLMVAAEHTGTGHSIEVDAATPWLALEKSHARLGWFSAEIFDGTGSIAKVEHLPLQKNGVWRIVGSGPEVVEPVLSKHDPNAGGSRLG